MVSGKQVVRKFMVGINVMLTPYLKFSFNITSVQQRSGLYAGRISRGRLNAMEEIGVYYLKCFLD